MSTLSESTHASATGVRRSGRISKEIAITLSGSDAGGRQFSERTRTLLLSLHGASVICHQKLIPEQEIYLRVISSNREIEVRVCGEIGERVDGYIYGVAFSDPALDFWGIEFPPAEALPRNLIPVTLECSGCGRQVALQFDATEMDVYNVNEGSLRYCSHCGLSTVWKIGVAKAAPAAALAPKVTPVAPVGYAEGGFAPEDKVPEFELMPLSASFQPPAPPAQPNRRAERRTRMSFKACIRVSGGSEEVVAGEDMSRGGFSFHSARPYPVEAMIEAAVPYTPGAMSIFVPAQIANVAPLQNGKLFRYGVTYIRGPKR